MVPNCIRQPRGFVRASASHLLACSSFASPTPWNLNPEQCPARGHDEASPDACPGHRIALPRWTGNALCVAMPKRPAMLAQATALPIVLNVCERASCSRRLLSELAARMRHFYTLLLYKPSWLTFVKPSCVERPRCYSFGTCCAGVCLLSGRTPKGYCPRGSANR